MLARGLLVAHEVILTFALQVLHNVVNNAKLHLVETSSTSAFSGDSATRLQGRFGGLPLSFPSSQSCFWNCIVLIQRLSA